ncbi:MULTISPECIES: hypothetical protein [Paenibacillus]|uniref:Uncharacterized protein n=1 Tax=Paenibacillus albilobatus TaxID=2716884 RepID=A0A919XH79_9BACL|nr:MULTISPECIES: hypothetical protein [Paenibacillus]GIO32584.1 hypothetical protein J2TS6_37250 [Paenibacillus albilobatus]
MAKDAWNPDRKIGAALKKTCRMTGLMLLCWCVFFACSEAAMLAYDVIWKRLGE